MTRIQARNIKTTKEKTANQILINIKTAEMQKAKNRGIRPGITKRDLINRKGKLEAIAREQKRMGGEIDSKIMTDIKIMSELSGIPMRPFLMTSFEIKKELQKTKVDPNRKKVLEKEIERRE